MLSIIIVNYKNEQKTIDYVNNELCKITISHKIIVVNNLSSDNSNNYLCKALCAELIENIEQIKDINKRIYVVAHPVNLGFAKGNNLGVEFTQKHFDVDYILFSNNDIRFVDDDVVEQMLIKISNLPNVGIIGPRVIGLSGDDQSPEPYYSLGMRYIWRYWLNPLLPKKMSDVLFKFNYSMTALEGEHYKVMGSFFIVRKNDFIECGMMDSNTFLYGEEIILSERMKSISKKVYYYPKVTIVHEHGATISKTSSIRKMQQMQFDSETYYYKKYIGTSDIALWFAKISFKIYQLFKL